jgi:hypothetical protein
MTSYVDAPHLQLVAKFRPLLKWGHNQKGVQEVKHRYALAALALVFPTLASVQVVKIGKHFEETRQISCTGTCVLVSSAAVPSGKRLTITNVSCGIETLGTQGSVTLVDRRNECHPPTTYAGNSYRW